MDESLGGVPTKLKVFAHRGGWTPKEQRGNEMHEQNSIPRIKETLSKVDGCELDVTFTKDGVGVITHDNVSNMDFKTFQREHPNHGTVEDVVNWFAQEGMEKKQLYLDLKGADQDAYALMEMVNKLGERATIGSKDPAVVSKLLAAKKILGSSATIYLQIPDPAIPSVAINYAETLAKTVGLDKADQETRDAVPQLRPDGVHFYWPQNVLKDLYAETQGHGSFVSATDSTKDKSVSRFPNVPVLHDMQRARLREFVRLAKEKGFLVSAGSDASEESNRRMMEWGVDAIMSNIPEHSPAKTETPDKIPDPKTHFSNDVQLSEKALIDASTDDENRALYNRIARQVKKVPPIRMQFGI